MSIELSLIGVATGALAAGVYDLVKSYISSSRYLRSKTHTEKVRITLRTSSGEIKEIQLDTNDLKSITKALSAFEETDHVQKLYAE